MIEDLNRMIDENAKKNDEKYKNLFEGVKDFYQEHCQSKTALSNQTSRIEEVLK